MKINYCLAILLLVSNLLFSQKGKLIVQNIPDDLLENTNSTIINQDITVSINSQKSYTYKKRLEIKVYNENGLSNIDAVEYYDKSRKIKNIDAVMYNQFGDKLKDFKQKDFKDQAALDGYSILSDDRLIYLDFTPTEYPFILVYTCEIESENTAFLPAWLVIDDTFESVLKSSFTINYPNGLGFKYKEISINDYSISKNENANTITYLAQNIPAIKMEEFAPSFSKIMPHVIFGLEKFMLEGVEGNAKTWKDFGLWMNENLLKNTTEINEETKQKITSLIGDEKDPLKKAKIVYQYVQDKTRYVSIQLGIGGWKPMLAKEVDKLGYGDCKALSNYTYSLLKLVGVESYYTIVYGDRSKKDIQEDFVSMQGNHAILSIPYNNKLAFLECTSQTAPFGFEGNFTDDRNVLIIKPDGGYIVKTNNYNEKLNYQHSKSSYSIDDLGKIIGKLSVKSKGSRYADKYFLEKESKENIDKFYKDELNVLNNLKIEKVSFNNDKDTVEFIENISCTASNYGSISGNSIMFPLNAFNQFSRIPQRYRNRKNPVEISRGFLDEDEIEITIPENFILEAKPNNFNIKDKFGEYKTEIIIENPTKIIYKRSLFLYKGIYEKTEYENFRKFIEQIAKADNAKVLITKKP